MPWVRRRLAFVAWSLAILPTQQSAIVVIARHAQAVWLWGEDGVKLREATAVVANNAALHRGEATFRKSARSKERDLRQMRGRLALDCSQQCTFPPRHHQNWHSPANFS
jgi:hypothetical protein